MLKPQSSKPRRFISLRWRIVFPVALMVLIVAMIGAYGLAMNLTQGLAVSSENVLRQSSQAAANRSDELYLRLRSEALRVAYTYGVAEAIRARQNVSLHPMLESLAIAGDLDSIIVTDALGIEVTGLLRVILPELTDYSISTETDLSQESAVRVALEARQIGAAALWRSPEGLMLYVSAPITLQNELIGAVLVGLRLERVLTALETSALTDLTLYDVSGQLLQTTYPVTAQTLTQLTLDRLILAQVVTEQRAVQSALSLEDTPYWMLYAPFGFGATTLGVLGVSQPNYLPFATAIGRQMTALFAAALAGAAIISAFVMVGAAVNRLNRVTRTAFTLAQGQREARVPVPIGAMDEIGVLGQALNRYADTVQAREDHLQGVLRRQRRERNYLLAVLQAMPNGVLIQDAQGRVLMMNPQARQLLATQGVIAPSTLKRLTETIRDVLGTLLAPGIYALGDPMRLEHGGNMLSAQAAAIMSSAKQRLGTVIVLRDITAEVKAEQAREALLTQLAAEVQQPLATLAQDGVSRRTQTMVGDFARDISRHAAALQKMIVEMRELTQYNRVTSRPKQQVLEVETLIWGVANDWRQIASAANLSLQVVVGQIGLLILGDEQRLRLAIGNLVDNAIKYTPAGGKIALEIKGEVQGAVHVRVRDNGVGISAADLPHIFMPFYRGTPVMADGQVIRVPGMGQGLALAKQLIEAHGGMMKVKSRAGVGTAVYLALPLTSGYAMPILSADELEGETVRLPDQADLERYWA